MFGFIPDMLLIILGAGLALGVWRVVERRKVRRQKPTDTAEKFS